MCVRLLYIFFIVPHWRTSCSCPQPLPPSLPAPFAFLFASSSASVSSFLPRLLVSLIRKLAEVKYVLISFLSLDIFTTVMLPFCPGISAPSPPTLSACVCVCECDWLFLLSLWHGYAKHCPPFPFRQSLLPSSRWQKPRKFLAKFFSVDMHVCV